MSCSNTVGSGKRKLVCMSVDTAFYAGFDFRQRWFVVNGINIT